MESSVLDMTEPADFVEEIRLNLHNDINGGEIIILVEGDDDIRSYRKFFDSENVGLQPVNNCYKLVVTMSLICADDMLKDCVIAIKDADFDHLMSVSYPDCPNMFLTDTHDVETLMMTGSCCLNICTETMLPEKYDLGEDVARAITNFSYLKYYNVKEIVSKGCSGLIFNGIRIGNLYDGVNSVTVDTAWDKVNNHGGNSSKGVMPTKKEFSGFIAANYAADLMNLTNGHDMIDGIVKRIHTLNPAMRKYGSHDIERIVRSSYNFSDFQKTKLYFSITSWADARGLDLWRKQ